MLGKCLPRERRLYRTLEPPAESGRQSPSRVLDTISQVRGQKQGEAGLGHREEPRGQVLSGEKIKTGAGTDVQLGPTHRWKKVRCC